MTKKKTLPRKQSTRKITARKTQKKQWHLHHKLAWVLSIGAIITTGIAAIPSIITKAYGPERPTYTIEVPADHITFNSITNDPEIGDERNFVGARDAATGDNGMNNQWKDNEITVEEGHEYIIRVYVHNNAAQNLKLVANNVKAFVNLPTATAKSMDVFGTVSADNATPKEVYDHVTLKSDKNFNIVPVEGSIKWENNCIGSNHPTGDCPAGVGGNGPVVINGYDLFTSKGLLLGYSAMDGKIPGCYQYSGYLTFRIKPQFQHTAAIGITKAVAEHNEIADAVEKFTQTKWHENIIAKPGQVVDFLIDYRNAGDSNNLAVLFRDALPTGFTYVPDSTKYIAYRSSGDIYGSGNVVNEAGKTDETVYNVTTYGLNASTATSGFAPTTNEHSYILMFSAKVDDNIKLVCGRNTVTNIAYVSADIDGVRFYNSDTANVTLDGECTPPSCEEDGTCPPEITRTGAGLTIFLVVIVAAAVVYHHYYVQHNKLKKPAHHKR